MFYGDTPSVITGGWYGTCIALLKNSGCTTLQMGRIMALSGLGLHSSGVRPSVFQTFLLHALVYSFWAEIVCSSDQGWMTSLAVNVCRSYMPHEKLKYASLFSILSLICLDMLSWFFLCDYLFIHVGSSLSVSTFRKNCESCAPFWTYMIGIKHFSAL